jgi:hypothetical protein
MGARTPMETGSPPVACGLAGEAGRGAGPDVTTEVAPIKREDEADFAKLGLWPEKAK